MAIYMKPAQAENYIACPWNSYLELFCGYKSPFAQENLLGGASHVFIAGLHKQKSAKTSLIRPTSRFTTEHLESAWQGLWMNHLSTAKNCLDGHIMDFYEDGSPEDSSTLRNT